MDSDKSIPISQIKPYLNISKYEYIYRCYSRDNRISGNIMFDSSLLVLLMTRGKFHITGFLIRIRWVFLNTDS